MRTAGLSWAAVRAFRFACRNARRAWEDGFGPMPLVVKLATVAGYALVVYTIIMAVARPR